jgi:hypothetical protein
MKTQFKILSDRGSISFGAACYAKNLPTEVQYVALLAFYRYYFHVLKHPCKKAIEGIIESPS